MLLSSASGGTHSGVRPRTGVAAVTGIRAWHLPPLLLRPSCTCQATEATRVTSLEALYGDEWLPYDDVVRMMASHMSLECDFDPAQVWPSLQSRDAPTISSETASSSSTTTTSAARPTAHHAVAGQGPTTATSPRPRKQLKQGSNEAATPLEDTTLVNELLYLEQLLTKVQQAATAPAKIDVLRSTERVSNYLNNPRHQSVCQALQSLSAEEQYVLLCLPALGQDHVLVLPDSQTAPGGDLRQALHKLAVSLLRVEQFYDSLGGVLGYQHRSINLIVEGNAELKQAKDAVEQAHPTETHTTQPEAPSEVKVSYHVPRALDLAGEGGREVGSRTAAAGLMAMQHMAEIYPVGGAGDRLGLQCEATGESLPAAMLPYCGRTMLEGLMRDLQAREYLYWKLTGKQVTTPVAIMTSEAKGNHQRIVKLMKQLNWFGRGRNAFRIFKQPLVPVLNITDGRWLLSGLLHPMSKPGGHGAIWKLMWDEGVFSWFKALNRTAALVRQISNPMAGMDTTLLALAGCGASRKHSAFGFMSCDRTIGASEGCNVLQERRVKRGGQWYYEYGYTNIEYTEFERLGISDQPVDGTSRRSVFPANTNVLYVGLEDAKRVVKGAIRSQSSEQLMPGLIFNTKKQVSHTDPLTGQHEKVYAGRMECTMQNIADYMTDRLTTPLSPSEAAERELSTFLVYNMRRKVTSSAKKKRDPKSTRISQTPDGSFYDLQRNAWHLLQQCNVQHTPELGSVEQYLKDGPGFIFLFNPALGPLWDVISQKLVGGSLQQGSEMVLEVAEARLKDVHVEGSLLIYADNIVGHMEPVMPVQPDAEEDGTEPKPTPTATSTPTFDLPTAASSGAQDVPVEHRLSYSSTCGRVHMSNVHIHNAGIDWAAPGNVYWQHKVTRREAVRIVLHGQSEFEAHNVRLTGNHTFEVPDGYRMVVTQDALGSVCVNTYPLTWGMPTWQWVYTMSESGQINLLFVSGAGASAAAAAATAANTIVLPSLAHVTPPPLVSPLMNGAGPVQHGPARVTVASNSTAASSAEASASAHSSSNGATSNGVHNVAQRGARKTPAAARTGRRTPAPPSDAGSQPSSWHILQQLDEIDSGGDFSI